MRMTNNKVLPTLKFTSHSLEEAYKNTLAERRAKRDLYVLIPWALLWVGIIARNRRLLTLRAVIKSFMSFTVITSPSWLQLTGVIDPTTYCNQRTYITTIAKAAFVFHAGGGIYREGMAGTAPGAFALFVQLLMASRVLFWLVLQFGYAIDWIPSILIESVLMWQMSKGTEPFCRFVHSSASESTLRNIAAAIPQFGAVLLPHSALHDNANVCGAMMLWLQIGMGVVLPVFSRLVEECWERQRFAKIHSMMLTEEERRWWLWDNIEWIPELAIVVYLHLFSFLWWLLIRITPPLVV